jgi:hypothetical protein
VIDRPSTVTRAASRTLGITLLIAIASGCGIPMLGGGDPPEIKESMSPAWYSSNAPLLTDYLATLPDSAIGKPIDGILLSDGAHWLAGLTYLGRPEVRLPEGVNVRLFDDGTIVTAYVWLEPETAPFILEPCTDGPQRGIRARRAGGGAYAWRALEPDHGLVTTICPPGAWLPEDRPSNRPPPDRR